MKIDVGAELAELWQVMKPFENIEGIVAIPLFPITFSILTKIN